MLLAAWPHLIKLAGTKSDFTDADNKLYELKSDYYDMNATSNFFIERWSDVKKQKPGSVWQAAEHGTDIFCYLYIKNRTCYTMLVKDIVPVLDELIKTLTPVFIENTRWTTVGYKVPRAMLEQYFKVEVLVEPVNK